MRYEIESVYKCCGPYGFGCSGDLSENTTERLDHYREATDSLAVAIDILQCCLDAPDTQPDEVSVKQFLDKQNLKFASEEHFKQACRYYMWRAEKFSEAKAFIEARKPGVWKADIPEEVNSFGTGLSSESFGQTQQLGSWVSITVSDGGIAA